MKKNITTILLVCAVALGFALSGCGSVDSRPLIADRVISSVGRRIAGHDDQRTVSLKDSSVPAVEKTTTPGAMDPMLSM